MIGTETDSESLKKANDNIERNNLSMFIKCKFFLVILKLFAIKYKSNE